jgi:Niemann-Pick C1 protein
VIKQKFDKGILYAGFKKIWAPVLLQFPVRVGVIVVFLGWLCSSLAVIPYIDVGLDQELSMPEDSYVTTYFKAMKNYLSVGPPVYFVVKDTDFDYSNYDYQELIRSGEFPSSLTSQIFSASKTPDRTYIAKPTSSWLDDYFDWAANENCCKLKKYNGTVTGEFCPSSQMGSRYGETNNIFSFTIRFELVRK